MAAKTLNKEIFDFTLMNCLKNIDESISKNYGALLAMSMKLQFEKWFQVELTNQLCHELAEFEVEIHLEYELRGKTTKRGKTIDIVIIQNKKEFIGLELKLIPTNYSSLGFSKKTKRVTEIVNDFISDISKTSTFIHSYSLALVYPFPNNPGHRNYSDFLKQEARMRIAGDLEVWNSSIKGEFISRYYLLHKKN